jgi:hypothetical protein
MRRRGGALEPHFRAEARERIEPRFDRIAVGLTGSAFDPPTVALASERARFGAPTQEDKAARQPPLRTGKPAGAPTALPVAAFDSATVVADASERRDSAAPGIASTLPAMPAAPQLRNVAPEPVAQSRVAGSLTPAEAIVTRGARSPTAAVRGNATTTRWPIISQGTARTLLGTDPVGLPGLARKIRRSPAADGTVVVEQQIDPTTTIQIFQRQSAAGYSDSSVKVEQQRLQERDLTQTDRLARYVGRLRVEIAGPLSVDSLNRLLNQVQPLP